MTGASPVDTKPALSGFFYAHALPNVANNPRVFATNEARPHSV
jgi:hypothetical protein